MTKVPTLARAWTDHVVWAREFIVACVEQRPDAPECAARLLKTPTEIGRAVEKAQGRKEGRRVGQALRGHVRMMIDLVEAACADNKQRYREVETVWDASDEGEPWHRHVELLKALLVARMEENYDLDVKLFDELLTLASNDAESFAA